MSDRVITANFTADADLANFVRYVVKVCVFIALFNPRKDCTDSDTANFRCPPLV